MVIAEVDVQPFEPVTVVVYVPGRLTFNKALDPTFEVPFDQAYEVPPVAVKAILVVPQVNTVVVGVLMAAVGAIIFCVTIDDVAAEHPLDPVTVTV
jgi:hypothetical protein